MHNGACDFIVNTLDEALRAMKNEIRQRRPLSVGLEGDPEDLLHEILERASSPSSSPAPLTPKPPPPSSPRGATILDLEAALTSPNPGWHLQTFTFDTSSGLRDFDAHALSLLSPEDTLRRRWLQSAPPTPPPRSPPPPHSLGH